MLLAVEHPGYGAGQVWAYETRPGEEESTLTILRTEVDDAQQSIIHICVLGVHLRNPHTSLGFSTILRHLPCSEQAINRSVTRMVHEHAPAPDCSDGYQAWREEFDIGQAGVWDIPVAEIIDAMESVLNQPRAPAQ